MDMVNFSNRDQLSESLSRLLSNVISKASLPTQYSMTQTSLPIISPALVFVLMPNLSTMVFQLFKKPIKPVQDGLSSQVATLRVGRS